MNSQKLLSLIGAVLASSSFAATRFVGGGLEIGATAPVFAPFDELSPAVTVSQILYTQQELGLVGNSRIIDVAWRKDGLGPITGAGGCGRQVWMKNVSRTPGPFAVGSMQTLTDALLNAQKVIDRAGGALPSSMGFVTLDATENAFSFDYPGDALEVTVITDCRSAAAPTTTAPIRWRYDVVDERVRIATGDSTDGLILTASPVLSAWRPHTRFRTLIPTPGIALRVANNVLPNGGAFAVAPKHFANGLPANFAFELVNESQAPVTLNSITLFSLQNGTATTPVTTPVTIAPGQARPFPLLSFLIRSARPSRSLASLLRRVLARRRIGFRERRPRCPSLSLVVRS